MGDILNMLGDATPAMLLGYTLGAFLALVALGAVIVYWIACASNKKTWLGGIMRVSVALNEWAEGNPDSDSPKLAYGEYWISMKDPAGIVEYRLDPQLGAFQKAACRKYAVARVLDRFRTAYDMAGFHADPSSELLKELMGKDTFCNELGSIFRKSSRKGLGYQGAAQCKTYKNNRDKVMVSLEVPTVPAENFKHATGCEAECICITMEYFGSR